MPLLCTQDRLDELQQMDTRADAACSGPWGTPAPSAWGTPAPSEWGTPALNTLSGLRESDSKHHMLFAVPGIKPDDIRCGARHSQPRVGPVGRIRHSRAESLLSPVCPWRVCLEG